MRKNILFPAIIVLIIIICTIFISDGLIYLIASLMALSIMGTMRRNRSRVLKMTRWAKANPKKAQVLITGLQIALMALGIFSGNNLKQLGCEFSDTTAYVFSTIIVIGFLSVPFLPKRRTIALPQVVERHKLAYMGIALSYFATMVLFGNRIGDEYPNSPITHVVKAIDQAIFPDNGTLYTRANGAASDLVNAEGHKQALTDEPSATAVFTAYMIDEKNAITSPTDLEKDSRAKLKAEKKAHRLEKKKGRMMNRIEKYRLAFAGGSGALAVLLILLLLGPLCAGICLIIGAFGEATLGTALLGVVITGASIWGIVAASKMFKRKNKSKP